MIQVSMCWGAFLIIRRWLISSANTVVVRLRGKGAFPSVPTRPSPDSWQPSRLLSCSLPVVRIVSCFWKHCHHENSPFKRSWWYSIGRLYMPTHFSIASPKRCLWRLYIKGEPHFLPSTYWHFSITSRRRNRASSLGRRQPWRFALPSILLFSRN